MVCDAGAGGVQLDETLAALGDDGERGVVHDGAVKVQDSQERELSGMTLIWRERKYS